MRKPEGSLASSSLAGTSIISEASLAFARGAEKISRTMVISSPEGGVELEDGPDHADGAESDVCGWEEDSSSAEVDESLTRSGITSLEGLGVDNSGMGEIWCGSVLKQ
jgi:hypothetical protein